MFDNAQIEEQLTNTGKHLLNGNVLLNEHRLSAIEAFRLTGIPGSRHEEWKYDNLSFVRNTDWQWSAGEVEGTEACIEQYGNHFRSYNRIVCVNGVFNAHFSRLNTAAIKVMPLKDALSDEKVFSRFNKLCRNRTEAFTSINTARFDGGVYIELCGNGSEPCALHVMHVFTNEAAYWCNPRTLLVAQENTHSKVVETWHAEGKGALLINQADEMYLDKSASLEWTRIQRLPVGKNLIVTSEISGESDSVFTCNTVSLAGDFIRNNLHVAYNGTHCNCHLNGLYQLRGNDMCDNHILVDHRLPESESNQLYKGIIDDEASAVFNGKIFVQADAQKTNAYQSNKTILLSDKATIYSKPQLEIFADDVKCSHGATSGHLDAQALFYLRARGITDADARALLAYAFASEVMEKISADEVRNYCDGLLKQHTGIVL